MSWGVEISNIDLSYIKLCERYIQLWTIYSHTLLKLFNCFYTKFMDKNMFPQQFVKKFDQSWILLQLLCCNLKK
jgi:hypothetical protein